MKFLREDDCSKHPLWQKGLPARLSWMQCQGCFHVFRKSFFTDEGLKLLFSRSLPHQVAGSEIDVQRALWAEAVNRVNRLLPEAAWSSSTDIWIDVGCGSGALVMTADEFGFKAIGVDTRQSAVNEIVALGYNAVVGNLNDLTVTDPVSVISLADVLEHVPHPRIALKRVFAALKPQGVLFVSCPNYDCAPWRASTRAGVNPYWGEIEHFHNFSRASLMRLLCQEGFAPVDYQISRRYKSCMEILAVRTKDTV